MSKPLSARNPAMDIIRCFAFLGIIVTHFFLYSGYFMLPMEGGLMYGMTILHQLFMISVPLFLMLSGFLLKNKKPNLAHYSKLGKTLTVYLLASLCCILWHRISCAMNQQAPTSLLFQLISIFSYTTAPYGWYINMYIGLFVVIPFLNVLYNNLETQRSKQGLILAFLFLSSFPNVVNIFRFNDLQWWLDPSSVGTYHPLIPDWWYDSYPLTYYFIGAYLREYPLKLKTSHNALLILASAVVFGTFQFYRSCGSEYVMGVWQDWGSLFLCIQAVLYFSFFARLDYSRVPGRVCRLFARLSDLCLGGYLVSSIFDEWFYGILKDRVPEVTDRFPYFLVMVPLIAVCSLALSALINAVYRLLARMAVRLRRGKPAGAA